LEGKGEIQSRNNGGNEENPCQRGKEKHLNHRSKKSNLRGKRHCSRDQRKESFLEEGSEKRRQREAV